VTGVLKGVSAVFFAYIGFDAISTTRRMQGSTAGFTAWYDVGDYHMYVLYIVVALGIAG
jgi:hypothetical protein